MPGRAAVVGILLVLTALVANRQVVPVGKASWMPRFGEPGPPTDREMPQRHRLPRKLTVHILPHSHSDVGWNLSFEGYYRASVRKVLRGVVAELWADARRRFTWGDLAFLDLWLGEEGDQRAGAQLPGAPELTWRQAVMELQRRGQWETTGGTYVSPDEGLTTWWAHNMIVDVGHRTLARELNATTAVGWQIDNFGHSNTVAQVLGSTGYRALIMGRMDFRDRYEFASRSSLQFRWRSSEHAGAAEPLLVHFLADHYAAPSRRFDFDHTAECDPRALLGELMAVARRHVRMYPAHGHVLVMMGDDFRYVRAARGFRCLDRVVAASKAHAEWADAELRYSTASEYLAAARPFLDAAQGELRVHGGDFYPYQDRGYEQYWSGILGSRAYLKWLVRDTEQIVQHVEALLALAQIRAHEAGAAADGGGLWAVLEDALELCRKQVAIGYHHDAITGTCSEAAFDDYARRLRAAARVGLHVGQMAILGPAAAGDPGAAARRLRRAFDEDGGAAPGYNTATDDALRPARGALEVPAEQCGAGGRCAGATVVVANANLLAPQDQIVRLRVRTAAVAVVDRATGRAVDGVHVRPDAAGNGTATVEFLARGIPAFGMRSYLLTGGAAGPPEPNDTDAGPREPNHTDAGPREPEPGGGILLRRGGVEVRLRAGAHGTVHISAGGRTVDHQLRYYFANPHVQASGAYVMHSFALMYAAVFWTFGAAAWAGLAAAWAVHRWRGAAASRAGRLVRALRLPRALPRPPGRRLAAWAAAVSSAAAGAAFVWYAAQRAPVERLDAWARGRGLAAVAAPAFAGAYGAAGLLRWRAGTGAAAAHGLAAGVALALLLGREWQSRPLAAAPLDLRVERGALCDRAHAAVGASGSRIEFRLCADAPDLLHVRALVRPLPDREIVARLADAREPSGELAVFDGAAVRRRAAGRWTPVPGAFFAAPSHVALGRLVVHARQPMGAASLAPGRLELLLHRSMSGNDFRGLARPLDDAVPAVVTHLLDLAPDRPRDPLRLAANHRANAPPLAFVLPAAGDVPPAYAAANATADPALRLVGVRAAPAAAAGRLRVDARLVAHEPVSAPPHAVVRGAAGAAEVRGDWALCARSAAPRTVVPVPRLRLAAGEQKLFRLDVAPPAADR
ncbi:mannosyl-oligosaccharide 1,3-1,6-alpha-mannosidase activity protein [Coemansia javaensis]|uniref:Mannosyl-oligosaccharide 1,3-1,6-alpha-mannosidase activity protein n=1 Tax=Coemansia javaensis TaxID=2761396 RepID=A0A9W8H9M2_9FUNG|nr:mannosyl-oligosaccharide 1,3-1,6-alpha-mannosidase activity protein [Coemansia javaensis]